MDFVKSPLPPAMGVAEWALDLVNREFTEPAKVDKLLDTWPKHQVRCPHSTQRRAAPRRAAGAVTCGGSSTTSVVSGAAAGATAGQVPG